MKYNQIKQKSRLYEYGEGKEFETREKALEAITELKQRIGTILSLEGFYKVETRDIKELENSFQLVVTIKIPIFFKEETGIE